MVHPVLQFMFIDVEHSAHECEVDPFLGIQVSVLLHTVAHVCEIVCDSGTVIQCDSSLDVAEKGSRLLLHPFSDLDHGASEPRFRIGIPASDPSRYSSGAAVGLFERCLLSAHFIIP